MLNRQIEARFTDELEAVQKQNIDLKVSLNELEHSSARQIKSKNMILDRLEKKLKNFDFQLEHCEGMMKEFQMCKKKLAQKHELLTGKSLELDSTKKMLEERNVELKHALEKYDLIFGINQQLQLENRYLHQFYSDSELYKDALEFKKSNPVT